MPTITIVDPTHVLLDGEPAGAVVDVLANHAGVEGLGAAMHEALLAWDAAKAARHEGQCASLADERKAAVEDLTAAHEAVLAERDATLDATRSGHQAELDELAARHEAALAELRAKVAEQAGLIDALGGTELGQQMAREARRKALAAEHARIAAELAAIDESASEPKEK